MRKATMVASVLLTVFALSSLWMGVAGARSNRWVEVWCDSDVTNGDGAVIDLEIDSETGQTIVGADDRIGKILDASALEPGNKEAATTAYNANAGFIQGWYCGALRYWDGTIVQAPAR